ncbi:MAG: hypothetical protein JW703_04685 [Candidatus Diapherotrites archaeon]|nr:hypothetical protein [Candidatus Diapherotrites archaeon]
MERKTREELTALKNKVKYKELVEEKIKLTSKLDQLHRIEADEKRIQKLEEELKKIDMEMRFLET